MRLKSFALLFFGALFCLGTAEKAKETTLLSALLKVKIAQNANDIAASDTSEDLSAQSIVDDTNSSVTTMELYLYRQKTKLSLHFLNQILHHLADIHENQTDLLKASASLSHQSFDLFKETDGDLEAELTELEKAMGDKKHLLTKYSVVLKKAEKRLNEVRDTLATILFPNSPAINEAGMEEDVGDDGDNADQNVLKECGGTLEADSGSIVYKNGEDLSSFESCVWIISTNGSFLSFSLISSGFKPQSHTFLSIGYFVNSAYDTDRQDQFQWTKFPSSVPALLEIPSPVAFVQFFSTPKPGSSDKTLASKGFLLNFESLISDAHNNNYVYNNNVITDPTIAHRYPIYGQYAKNERTAIFIQPTRTISKLRLNWWDLEEEKYDSLNIWKFDTQLTWTKIAKLGDYGSSRQFTDFNTMTYMLLLAFKSDGSVVKNGFEFKYWIS